MHLLLDENGSPVPHGAGDMLFSHASQEDDCGQHEHCGACGHEDGKCQDETLSALVHLIRHNGQYTFSIDRLAAQLEEKGMEDAAQQARRCAAEIQKGSIYLNLALSLYRQHMLEKGLE